MSKITGQKIKSIWKRLAHKSYRDSFVESRLSNNLSFQIYHMRESRKWTQDDLATHAGMKQPAISRLERSIGSASLATLRKIASAFDVAVVVRFVPFSRFLEDAVSDPIDQKVQSFADDGPHCMSSKFQPLLLNIDAGHRSIPSFRVVTDERRYVPPEYYWGIVATASASEMEKTYA